MEVIVGRTVGYNSLLARRQDKQAGSVERWGTRK